MQELTHSLWQSWLVPICDGRGPEVLSYKERDLGAKYAAVPRNNITVTRRAVVIVTVPRGKRTTVASNYSDPSTEGIDQIRRSTRV